MNTSDLKRAQAIFFQYDGTDFYMHKDGVLNEFLSYKVPTEVKEKWFAEIIAQKVEGLKHNSNWWPLYFLVNKGLHQFYKEVMEAKPLGNIDEKISFIKLQITYINELPKDILTEDVKNRVLNNVRIYCESLTKLSRSEKTRTLIQNLLDNANKELKING